MDTEVPNPASSRRTRSLRQRVGRATVLYILVPYFAVTIIFAVFQRRLMYQPTVANRLSITDSGLGADFGIDVELTTADGNTIRGWLINGRSLQKQDRGNAPLVLYFPGNSLNRSERINDLREVAARGFDVLIFDYRGFGDSTGSPTESTLSADALLVWQYARNTLGYNERRIVVFGESIGGAVALSMWSKTNSRASTARLPDSQLDVLVHAANRRMALPIVSVPVSAARSLALNRTNWPRAGTHHRLSRHG